jgi:hypothetical protein
MLWYKGWLETRFRLLFIVGWAAVFLTLQHASRTTAPASGAKSPAFVLVMFSVPILVLMVCALLGGAGIVTQPSFQATKGLHGSTLYTLSMPVSRLRLLVIRAGIGWLEVVCIIAVLCCGMWFASPAFRAVATPVEMMEYAATLVAGASAFYCFSVLLATFLDDQWRAWGSVIGSAAVWWLFSHIPLPASANIFQAMREQSPLLVHTMPWTAIAFSLGLAAILFFAALKVVQTREY